MHDLALLPEPEMHLMQGFVAGLERRNECCKLSASTFVKHHNHAKTKPEHLTKRAQFHILESNERLISYLMHHHSFSPHRHRCLDSPNLVVLKHQQQRSISCTIRSQTHQSPPSCLLSQPTYTSLMCPVT